MRLFHPNMRERDVRGIDTRRFIAHCAVTNADGIVVSAGGIYAFYPSGVKYHYVSPAAGGRDFLKEVVEHGRSAGLRVIARVDFSKAREEVFRAFPNWFACRSDGSPIRAGRFYQVCPCCPYAAAEFAVPVIREILRGYAIDGFHLNAGGFPGFCYREHCRQRFRSTFGAELPAKADWASAEWRRFLAWRYEGSAQNFALLRRTMDEERPGVSWTGELAGLDGTSWMRNRAYDIVRLSSACSAVMSTIDNVDPAVDMRWVSGMTAGYARSVSGRPPIINLKAQIRDGGWPRGAIPAPEYASTAWQAIAHGASLRMPIFGIPGSGEDERNMPVIAEVLGVLKRHARVYEDARPAAPVALVWSQRTLDFYGRDDAEARYASAAHGFYSALVESHIPCAVVGDDAIAADRLKGYAALVLPNVACLSEAQAAAVSAFARNGGAVVSTFETSLYDTGGDRRGRYGLEQLFGARCTSSAAETPQRGSYFYKPTAHELTASFGTARIVPFGGQFLRAVAGEATEVLLALAKHFSSAIPEEIENPEPENVPLCLVNGRSVYFPGAIDRFYFPSRLPGVRELLASSVAWALGGRTLVTNAPGGVQLGVTEKPGYTFVHFINAVGRAPLDEVAPLSDVEVTIEARRGVRGVRSLLAGEQPASSQHVGKLYFRLPRLNAYEVVVVEWT
ncbi:MAG: beta-galactosidase trimerization domain-containing protein [Acidobacteria bacterium]|nr:beta-galactosidase trimerization domain-containing protein [Acidobacteriota bacterium]